MYATVFNDMLNRLTSPRDKTKYIYKNPATSVGYNVKSVFTLLVNRITMAGINPALWLY